MPFLKTITASLGVGFIAFTTLSSASAEPKYAHTGPTIITNVSVIDGLGNAPVTGQDIVLIDGKIAAIGATGSVAVPDGALKIDGSGMTAMPGLIDMHVHLYGGWGNGFIEGKRYEQTYDDKSIQQTLSAYLYSGVTTIFDVANKHDYIVKTRNRINNGELMGPRVFTVGAPFSQTPGGWDDGSFLVTSLDEIPAILDSYKKDGIEIIKLYTGISHYAAYVLIREAHKRDMKAIADFWALNMNRGVMDRTGLDGWAHAGGFSVVPMADHKWTAKNDRFLIATANVGQKLSGARVAEEGGKQLMLKEPLIVNVWGKNTVTHFYDIYDTAIREASYEGPKSFYQSFGFGDMKRFFPNFLENIGNAHKAGVPIGCGTDSPFPSVWPGEAMHYEMELLVRAGLQPLEAIKACTSNSAQFLRRGDKFGALLEGLSADILIVQGNPAKNISDSRNVRYVLSKGKLVDRDSLVLKP
jgi:imidazolonepropionase-like amidohydrolase